MWGHARACAVCSSFYRVFALVNQGSQYPGFVPLASGHVRVLEAELRDSLQTCPPPPVGTGVGPPQPTSDPRPSSAAEQVPAEPSREEAALALASQPKKTKAEDPALQCLVPKPICSICTVDFNANEG